MKRRTYDTPAAFKRAVEDRLKAASTSGVDFARRRQLLVFDRFLARMAHPIPARLPSPPEAWAGPYARMAELDELPWRTLPEVEAVARAFLDPLLASEQDIRWDPPSWSWKRLPSPGSRSRSASRSTSGRRRSG